MRSFSFSALGIKKSDDGERAKLYIEMWKQTIDVQKHFNDIELRIRGLALTVLTFVLGGASLAIRDGTTIRLGRFNLQFGALILLIGVLLWLIFYFVDQIWYHRLLIGAVIHGEELEKELRKFLPAAGLTRQITESSPYTFRIPLGRKRKWEHEIHSSEKIRIFYWSVAGLLMILVVIIQLALQPVRSSRAAKADSLLTQPVTARLEHYPQVRRAPGPPGSAWVGLGDSFLQIFKGTPAACHAGPSPAGSHAKDAEVIEGNRELA